MSSPSRSKGSRQGGADVVWIETMSALEEIRAAARAAIRVGMPYTVTASFDTAGRTMMGVEPAALVDFTEALPDRPLAVGGNCGVGASDLLVSVLSMTEAHPEAIVVAKANCGIPVVHGDHVHYSGTPELMADYARLAVDAGARIIGGCCGTSPEHLAAMRRAIDGHAKGERPTVDAVIAHIGPLASPPPRAERIARAAPVATSRQSDRRGEKRHGYEANQAHPTRERRAKPDADARRAAPRGSPGAPRRSPTSRATCR